MNLEINIIEKPNKNINEDIKVNCSSDVIKIKDVQAIRNAVREHLLFIGVDRGNNVRDISLLGIGSTGDVTIDTKEIIRKALLSACDGVILVHNHPSNNIKPSNFDLQITNTTKELLKVFHIDLLDHIIVTEKEFISMKEINKIGKNYNTESINSMTKGFLIEENRKLKQEINELKEKLESKDFELEIDM